LAIIRFKNKTTHSKLLLKKMNNFFRALIAGAAAKKFGGGCLGTIVVFALVWVALGQCGSNFPAKHPDSKIKEKKTTTTHIHPASCYSFTRLAV
jgi:hypothetical protein